MPHPFRLRITNERTGEVEEQAGEFSDAEWGQLSVYLANAHRLAACRLATSQHNLNFKISGVRGEQAKIEATLPPEDDIAAFLHYLRPLILTKSPTNFTRTRNTVARVVTLPAVRNYLKKLKATYAGKEIPFEIEIGSRAGRLVLNSEEAIDNWLNGVEYHQDDDKRATMDAAFGVFTAPASRAMLLYVLLQRAAAIGKLGAMIDGFARQEGRQVRVT